MTMVPANYLSKSKQQKDSYNGCEDSYSSSSCLLGSDDHHLQLIMPEEESCCLNSNKEDEEEEDDDDNEPWLQLGLGGDCLSGQESAFNPVNLQTQGRCNELVELDLFPSSSSSSSQPISLAFNPTNNHVVTSTSSSNNMNFQPLLLQHHQQQVSWGYRPNYLWQPFTSIPSSSSLSVQPHPSLGMYDSSSPFQYPGYNTISPSSSSSGIKVIDAPRKLRSSVWFMIQASQNQAKEPFLPQISRRYLRIKDGKMTVHLVMKYLVKKLRLNSESEVAITCRGQQLPHFLTLQDVRDNIWRLRNAVVSFTDDSSTDYIMLLHYGRSAGD